MTRSSRWEGGGDVLLHDCVLLLMCYVKLSALRQLLRDVIYVRPPSQIHSITQEDEKFYHRGCDDKTAHLRFHPESSKPRPSPPPDYRPPVPHTGPGRPGSDERGHPPLHLFARASSGSSPLLCARRQRQLSTSLHAQEAAVFHVFARAGSGNFPLLCTRR